MLVYGKQVAWSAKGSVKKVVLACSGGLDSSIILKWLLASYPSGF
jgi:PP-loop superfamily ATP-utilizing enzyme